MRKWEGAPVTIVYRRAIDDKGMEIRIDSPYKAMCWPEWFDILDCWLENMKKLHAREVQAYNHLIESGKLVPFKRP